MIEILFENIQEHLSMLDLALQSSEKIKKYAQNENLDGVVSETENRERLVNIVAKIQRSVEDQINLLDPGNVSGEEILILKTWFQDLNRWSEKMSAFDEDTVELLGQQKESTTKEIALIFKNKEIFKSYNHQGKK
ncbi:MAG: hypothetical protein WC635_08265 [Bacteriovorax sp.]|jgi:hypothetical protein